MTSDDLQYLLQQYKGGKLQPRERQDLLKAFTGTAYEADILSWIEREMEAVNIPAELSAERAGQIFSSILEQEKPMPVVASRASHSFPRHWWVAACLVLIAGGLAYIWLNNKPHPNFYRETASADTSAGIQPGKEGAILTLADGSSILLDTVRNGIISLQGGTMVKVVNGGLLYEGGGGEAVYNTISTPRGRQYRITLPDDTHVWLNAQSSLRYPTAFTEKERYVQVTGEAYFEVTQNAGKPFRVDIGNWAKVDVLGTSFNVYAYENEPGIQATLVDGSIAVTSYSQALSPAQGSAVKTDGGRVMLKPGEQAKITAQQEIKVLKGIDLEKVTAWKDGLFNFEGATLREAMRQLERWYDIEVVYEQGVQEVEVSWKITKGVSFNDLLEGFKELGMHYKLEGKRLTIMP